MDISFKNMMDINQHGKLILINVPNVNVEQKAVSYLLRLMAGSSSESLTAKVRQAPLVLSKNISAGAGQKIAADLEKLGAYAVFLPHTTPV